MTPDYLTCEYELPVPEEVTNLMASIPDWEDIELHTYSFANSPPLSFDKYSISEDGQLYKEIYKTEMVETDGRIEVKEKREGIERQDYTGEILFSALHLDKDHDFFLQFKALFWKGDLKEIELEEWEKNDNKERKNIQKQLKKLLKEERIKENSRVNKAKSSILWVLSPILGLIRYLLGYTVRITWKIEGLFK